MNRQRAAWCAACLVLASCSLFTDNSKPRLVSASIVLTNTLRSSSARPPGPFASVLDSVALTVKSTRGEVLARNGYKLRAYDSTASLSVDIPAGDATFEVQALSNNRTVVFRGSTLATVRDDGVPVHVTLEAERPVLLVLPDTGRTSTVTSALFTIYNAGRDALIVSVAGVDTALTRCGAACRITLGANSVSAGLTMSVRPSVPPNFPSRLLSFVLRSAEGDVPVFWQYTASSITSVTVQPPTALLVQGQTTPFTAIVQASGNASTAVNWSSENSSLVTVGSTGTATAVSLGLTSVIARSTVDTAKTGPAVIRVYDSSATARNWSIAVPGSTGGISVSRDGVKGNVDTVSIAALATGPSPTYPNPFIVVEFWARPILGGSWRRIGQSSAPTLRDNGQERTWAWTIVWNPSATDAPFANPSSTRMSIIAIGVAANTRATTTFSNSQITVVVP